jgi:CBS domain-containing protein
MLISEILSVKADSQICSIGPEQLLTEAVAQMVAHDVGSLVVMANGVMVGLITERDMLKTIAQRGCDFQALKVSEVMSVEPIIGSPTDTVDYVRGVITESRMSHLVVMDGDKLLGVISFHDVAKACLSDAKLENRLLKRYIRHWPE